MSANRARSSGCASALARSGGFSRFPPEAMDHCRRGRGWSGGGGGGDGERGDARARRGATRGNSVESYAPPREFVSD